MAYGRIFHTPISRSCLFAARVFKIVYISRCKEHLHPYSDQAMKPHNTKVFNLCRIKKVGIEAWAKHEAGGILDKYYYGKWTL